MQICSLTLFQFKNFEELHIKLSSKINYFYGNNGAGKTNILDALYYLSFCKSFFSNSDRYTPKNDLNGQFLIKGSYQFLEEQEDVYECSYKNERKIFKKNDLKYAKFSDHIGQVPLVFVSPSDHKLLDGSSDVRRRLFDQIISQTNKTYLDDLIAYNRLLAQRNKILKQAFEQRNFDQMLTEIIDGQLAERAFKIKKIRTDFTADFNASLQKFYAVIASDQEHVRLTYDSEVSDTFLNDLKAQFKIDCMKGSSSIGVHRDDYSMQINQQGLKYFGSQGQQKSFLIALRFAQVDYLIQKTEKNPIILLDDVFDKLDQTRVAKVFDVVNSKFDSQVFITSTDAELMKKTFINNKEIKFFEVNQGKVTES